MVYERIMIHFGSGESDYFDIDWHCFLNRIMMEGVAGIMWKDQEYTSGFDKNEPLPEGLYDIIDSYGLEKSEAAASESSSDRFSVLIKTSEYSKVIEGSSLSIPTEQIIMKMISLSPKAFQAIAWRVFGHEDEDIPQYPLNDQSQMED